MTGRAPSSLSGQNRQRFGCLVTFENAEGRRLTLHGQGPKIPAINRLCDTALRLDETFRMVSYSTPETIFTDLTGGRADNVVAKSIMVPRPLPEVAVLGLAGRPEMIHSSLHRATLKNARPRRRAAA